MTRMRFGSLAWFGSWAMMAAVAVLSGSPAIALDAPHNTLKCADCHTLHNAPSAYLTKVAGGINQACFQCHSGLGPALEVDTHASSVAGGGSYNFTLTCNQCHNPHVQQQPLKKFVKSAIVTPNSGTKAVLLNARTGSKSFADDALTPWDGVCEVCHTQTKYHRNDGTEPGPGLPHNDGADCTACHKHNDPGGNNFGFKPSGGDCLGCHNTAQNALGNNRRVITTDFTGTWTHHIQRSFAVNPLTKFDCVLCHLEGSASGGTTPYHNADSAVNLRDVDDPSNVAWAYQDNHTIAAGPNANPQITNATKFCLRCHDSDGYGDTAMLASMATAGDPIVRTAADPFGDAAALGTGALNVNAAFDVTGKFATHSISNYWAVPTGCGGNCPVNQHPIQSTGVCTADATCGVGACTNGETCAIKFGNKTCLCPVNYNNGNGLCNTCGASYSGVTCATFTDPCASQAVGSACGNNHGQCVQGTVEQISNANESFTIVALNGWANTTWGTGGANANTNNAHRNTVNSTLWLQTSFVTVGPSATYRIWVSSGILGSGGGRPTLTTRLDATSFAAHTENQGSTNWYLAGTRTLAAGTHTLDFQCSASTGWTCNVDGILITTDAAVTPSSTTGSWARATGNWDDAALDKSPTKYCVFNTGYDQGTSGKSCTVGYHLEGGACVADSAGACAGQTCSGKGTCYIGTGSAGICACNEKYYHSSNPLSCSMCSASSPSWQSGRFGPSFPGIRAGAWASTWTETSNTECMDCHSPGKLSGTTEPFSNNAHGSVNTNYMLDASTGLDTAFIASSVANNATSNITCFRCHARASYLTASTNTRMPNHADSRMMDPTSNKYSASGFDNMGIACFNCHGGSSDVSGAGGIQGSIHGEGDVITDPGGNGTYNAVLFINGASMDYWSGVGTTGTCSTQGTASGWNLNCTAHGGSRGYTRNY